MTANQRRSGFRLPWSSDEEGTDAPASDPVVASQPTDATDPEQESSAPASADATASSEQASGEGAEAAGPSAPASPPPTSARAASEDEPSPEFMRELVEAMRRVALETRESSATAARSAADEHVKELEADAERRRTELRERADADIAAVGEWARAEAERIRTEAEARVSARRTQLEQQLAAEAARAEADAKSVRDRIGEYERELEAFTAQLNEISDPAAFAAAAKRMPRPPSLRAAAATPPADASPDSRAAAPVTAPHAPTNGAKPAAPEIHPAEEEVLAARLAELDAAVPSAPATPASGTAPVAAEPVTSEIVVKGLGSFGAITSFRQALAGVEGVDNVALRLGETGEFIFRTTHAPSYDLGAAITALEGDAARIERRGEHDLLVTLERGR